LEAFMAKPRGFPVHDDPVPPAGGRSALKIVLVGALVAFGGYSAVAGASLLLGRAPDTAVAAKSEIDCGSSRFAWRPECQAGKAEVASTDGDGSRRARRRATTADEPAAAPAAPAVPAAGPSAVPTAVAVASLADPVATASVEPSAEAARPTGPTSDRLAKRPDPAAESIPIPPVRAVPREPTRPAIAASPPRERRAESPRTEARPKAAPEAAPAIRNSIRIGRAKVEAVDEAPRARAKLARRDAAQFASLKRERAERSRRTRLAAAWQPEGDTAEPGMAEDAWRSRREERFVRRRDRTPDRSGLPPGMTVTSVRTYVLPDGRLVSVNVRPRADEVRALIAQHRANTASYYPW
jgi:hypothetical protein